MAGSRYQQTKEKVMADFFQSSINPAPEGEAQNESYNKMEEDFSSCSDTCMNSVKATEAAPMWSRTE